ncbi:MAG: PQQ-dependent sugar dehydrogenase [Saprospiraceae bacterium]|nr:PQQ-dependent sugar dehydrogenase [Lewinellaceae bacterium]
MRSFSVFFLLALNFLFCAAGFAQPALTLTQITTVSQPVDIAAAGDGSGRLFLVEKGGTIRILDLSSYSLLPDAFLDISSLVLNSGERGLLGLTFHPDYANNGYFYVNYSQAGSGNTRISRFTATPPSANTADPASELPILTLAQPFTNHNGGDMAFGPDGYLYIALGDGGGSGDPDNRAQNGMELHGKMLRIDVNSTSGGNNYAIPPDNPFIGMQTPEILDEIWALGLRNPWRFSFDRNTGDIWIADVGQGAWEELNYQPASSQGGENYGWRCYEGNHKFNTTVGCGAVSSYVAPIFEYDHDPNTGGRSVSGGFVYRGNEVPDLQGWYVMADYTSDNFWLIQYNGSGWTVDLQSDVPVVDIVTFGEDDDGELYTASLGGQVYKITAAPLPVELLDFSGKFHGGRTELTWTTATEKNAAYFQVERQTAGAAFESIGTVPASGVSSVNKTYQFDDPYAAPGENNYRLKMVDLDNSFSYSPIISVSVKEPATWQLLPNPTSGRVSLSVNTDRQVDRLTFEVHNTQGQVVFSDVIEAPEFPFLKPYNLGRLPKGTYFCRIDIGEKTALRQLVFW